MTSLPVSEKSASPPPPPSLRIRIDDPIEEGILPQWIITTPIVTDDSTLFLKPANYNEIADWNPPASTTGTTNHFNCDDDADDEPVYCADDDGSDDNDDDDVLPKHIKTNDHDTVDNVKPDSRLMWKVYQCKGRNVKRVRLLDQSPRILTTPIDSPSTTAASGFHSLHSIENILFLLECMGIDNRMVHHQSIQFNHSSNGEKKWNFTFQIEMTDGKREMISIDISFTRSRHLQFSQMAGFRVLQSWKCEWRKAGETYTRIFREDYGNGSGTYFHPTIKCTTDESVAVVKLVSLLEKNTTL